MCESKDCEPHVKTGRYEDGDPPFDLGDLVDFFPSFGKDEPEVDKFGERSD